MQAFKRTKFCKKPVRLSKKQKKDPKKVIRDFYTWYHLGDLRHYLGEWVESAITTENPQFESAKDRSNLLFFCRNLELLAEAAFLIVKQDLPVTMKKNKKQENASE